MLKQSFSRVKKSLAILLAVLFVASMTIASASACAADNHSYKSGHCAKESGYSKDSCKSGKCAKESGCSKDSCKSGKCAKESGCSKDSCKSGKCVKYNHKHSNCSKKGKKCSSC